MKAIVHIGTEKTGTTSIQSFLYRNRSSLQEAGFHFLQCAGKTNNRALPSYCMSDDRDDDFYRNLGITTRKGRIAYKQDFIGDLEKELSELPADTRAVITSSEHFHSRIKTDEEMDNVHTLLSRYFSEIEVICYLRDQVTTCTSCYSTALKSGNSNLFTDFIQSCNPNNHYYDYWELLQKWEQRFGPDSLNVSLFSRERFLNGSLLDDFTAKIDPALVGTLSTNIRNENESLNPSGQALARAINLAFPNRSVRPELRAFREKCQAHIAERHKGKGRQLSPDTQRELFAAFSTINELVRRKYFPDEESILEPPVAQEDPDSIVVIELLEGFQDLLEIIRNSAPDVLQKEEHSGVYNILFSCMNELLYEHGEMKLIKTLSSEDARFLRELALSVEAFSVPAANLLLQSIDSFESTVAESEPATAAL